MEALELFNLLPIPPLDGSWVLKGLLPVRWQYYYQKAHTYIVIIFILAVISGKFHYVFRPLLEFFLKITVSLIK